MSDPVLRVLLVLVLALVPSLAGATSASGATSRARASAAPATVLPTAVRSADASTELSGAFIEHPQDVVVQEGGVSTQSVRFVPARAGELVWERSFDGGATWELSTVDPVPVVAGVIQSRYLVVGTASGCR